MRLNSVLRKFDGRMNPIAVKELRQISRGKFLPVILIGFLFTQLTIAGVVAFLGSPSPGPDLYRALFGFLTGVCGLLIPAYAGFRLAQERADMNRDLLFITTLKPSSIVWGKTLSAAVLAALIYSVCMPFIVMTYMLRGVDLLSAFLHIVQSYLFALTAILVGILMGGMPVNRFLKTMIGLFALLVVFIVQASGAAFRVPTGGSLIHMGVEEAFGAAFKFLCIWVLPSVGFFLLAAAFISPPSANRALAPRVYITAAWLVSFVGVVIWAKISNDHYHIYWWVAVLCAVFGWALAFGVSERDELGPRVRQAIPRSRLRRVFAFLFYSGSAGGFLWASAGIVMTYLAGSSAAILFGWTDFKEISEELLNFLGFASFNAWSAAVCAVFIHRMFLRNRVSAAYTWLIAVGVHLISNLLWAVFAFGFETYRGWDLPELLLAVLAVGAAAGSDLGSDGPPTIAAGVIALVLGCACLPWIVRQAAAFKPVPLKTRRTEDGSA